MYGVTQLRGGRTDLNRFKKRIQRSYGMRRLTIQQHDRLFVGVAELEALLDEIVEANNNGETEAEGGSAQTSDS